MALKLTIPDGCDYVHAEMFGAFTDVEIEAARARTAAFVVESGLTKVLLDATGVTSWPSTFGLINTTMTQCDSSQVSLKSALLGRPDQLREIEFVESITASQEYPLRAFTDRDAAVAWLEDTPSFRDISSKFVMCS